MPWSNKQKQIAVRACRQAGIDDAVRKLLLRQLPHAVVDGQPTSTAGALDNKDFERFMALVEDRAGGKVLHFTSSYWGDKAASRSTSASERQAHKINLLYREYSSQDAGGLTGHGIYGLTGLVRRMSAQRTGRIEELTPSEAHNLIELLGALIKRRGLVRDQQRQQRLFSDFDPTAGTPGTPGRSRRRRNLKHPPALTADEIPF